MKFTSDDQYTCSIGLAGFRTLNVRASAPELLGIS